MNIYDIAQMGYGEADITPETAVELVGFSVRTITQRASVIP